MTPGIAPARARSPRAIAAVSRAKAMGIEWRRDGV